ncbi:hypothetical protein ACIBKY_31735 [Nonomuraea sp. NPDC050394]|uniref:hypothetical protein n=1 Tax=Nonomuraea sp. NPDC050394 TaxID=3364363 RepID=UPI00379AF35F
MTAETMTAETVTTPGRRLPRHRYRIGLIALVAAAAYSVIGLVKLVTFRASTYDLVIVD